MMGDVYKIDEVSTNKRLVRNPENGQVEKGSEVQIDVEGAKHCAKNFKAYLYKMAEAGSHYNGPADKLIDTCVAAHECAVR